MPQTVVFLNGKFVTDLADARVSAFDAGFQHGVGLFETMLGGVKTAASDARASGVGRESSTETWVLDLDEHIARLRISARELGLARTLNARALAEAVLATVERSGLERARLRLTLTAGDLNMLSRAAAQAALKETPPPAETDPTIMIVAQPATRYPAEMYERGVAVVLADARANPLNPFEGHKTVNYWWRLRELQAAAAKGAAESLVLSVTNHVCSGCVSNVIVIKGDTAFTPPARGEEGRGTDGPPPLLSEVDAGEHGTAAGEVGRDALNAATHAAGDSPATSSTAGKPGSGYLPSPVLPGVVRAWALHELEARGLRIRREMLSLAELFDADEVMLTNSSWGVLPVVSVEGRAIGGTGAAEMSAEALEKQPGRAAARDASGKSRGEVGECSLWLVSRWRRQFEA